MCSTINSALPFSFRCEGPVNANSLHGGLSMSSTHRFSAGGRVWPNYSPQQSEMDWTWQELMAITELQEFEVPNDGPFEAGPYHPMEPMEHYGSCGTNLVEANPPTAHPSPAAAFEVGYADLISYQRLNPNMEMHYGYGGCQVNKPQPTATLQPPLMSLIDPINQGAGKHCNGHIDDIESDSGLSLGSSPPIASPANEVIGALAYLPHEGYTDGDVDCTVDPCHTRPNHIPVNYSHTFSSYAGHSYFPNGQHLHQHAPSMKLQQFPATLHEPPANHASTPRSVPFQLPNPKTKQVGMSGPLTRDERRAVALQIPFPLDKIINLPVDDFNELLSRHALSDAQLTLVRDIRRRGKNKVAAQNCRKRKLENIVHLEHELNQLRARRDHLARERLEFQQNLTVLKCRFSELYAKVFAQLRDEQGHPYSLEDYSLQQSNDGSLYLLHRNSSMDGD
ncbi:Nuclear factor erythroid 2-related factor 2 [Bagarius yarrelli]|uniref:Nuclear factor erythroid 2-related factor 2 n=1 Tax=Bagarius yarrelli TaxID=175774 RepID=A0A556U0C0_BAGYA|nr:Nuclear factor erythroid 2-related factor 2 [Bagarius yarrelli]